MTLDYSAFDVNMKIVKMFTDDYGRHQRVEIQLLAYLAEESYEDSGYVRGAEI